MNRKRIHSLARHFRKRLPVGESVSVRFTHWALEGRPDGWWIIGRPIGARWGPYDTAAQARERRPDGTCALTPQGFAIHIERNLRTKAALGTLMHEWAHALSDGLDGAEHHGIFFWLANQRCWSEYLYWLEGAK